MAPPRSWQFRLLAIIVLDEQGISTQLPASRQLRSQLRIEQLSGLFEPYVAGDGVEFPQCRSHGSKCRTAGLRLDAAALFDAEGLVPAALVLAFLSATFLCAQTLGRRTFRRRPFRQRLAQTLT
jgi:hypothetical protein